MRLFLLSSLPSFLSFFFAKGPNTAQSGTSGTELSYMHTDIFKGIGAKLLNGSACPLKEKLRCSDHLSLDVREQQRLVGLHWDSVLQGSPCTEHFPLHPRECAGLAAAKEKIANTEIKL